MQRQKLKVKSLFGKYEEFPIEWQIKTFDELFEFLRTGSNSRNDLQEIGEIYYIHYGDIHAKWPSVLDCDLEDIPRIDKAKVKGLSLLKEGDLIIADASEDYEGSGASILLRNVKDRRIVSGLHTIALRNIDENIYPDFKTYLNSIKFIKNQIVAYVTGISVYGLSKNNLKKIRIPLPPIKEQQKIATILSKVDKLIQKTEQIIAQTQRLKKGLMQRLLTKGIGHIKFKEIKSIFNKSEKIPSTWEFKKLEKLTNQDKSAIKMGPFGSDLKKHELLDTGKIMVLWIENIVNNEMNLDYKKFISEDKYKELKSFTVKPDDVLITMMGTLGRIAIVPNNIGSTIISSHLLKISLDKNKCIPKFLYYCLLSNDIKKQLSKESRGIVMEGLNTKIIKSLKIKLPPIQEQELIINILTNMDNKLKKLVQSNDELGILKKGLMQQLLTGKIRVKV